MGFLDSLFGSSAEMAKGDTKQSSNDQRGGKVGGRSGKEPGPPKDQQSPYGKDKGKGK